MVQMRPVQLCLCSLFLVSVALLAQQPEHSFGDPGPDAPELAARGLYGVGVRTIDLIHKAQLDVAKADQQTGKAPLYDRPLKIEIWYPSSIPRDAPAHTAYLTPFGRSSGAPAFTLISRAQRDAPKATGGPFPLVIVSHGFPGSRTLLSYLAENLASKGYVMAAIDHTDSVYSDVQSFPSTLLNRSNDQLFTIGELERLSKLPTDFLHDFADFGNAAIVGYSMGGYGALISGGASLSAASPLMKFVPGSYLTDWTASGKQYKQPRPPGLKAIVAIAPWGEQPPYNAWDQEGLAGIHLPTLFIAGDHDDVADFEQGIRPAFQRAKNSERCMLVYEKARHNTGGNPPPPEAASNFKLLEHFDEPVWRKERITEINQHFVTAFLDLYLKHNDSRRAYLHVTPVKSDDGQWPVDPNAPPAQTFSSGTDGAGHPFWKGFQRRWALGLDMYCYASGEAAH